MDPSSSRGRSRRRAGLLALFLVAGAAARQLWPAGAAPEALDPTGSAPGAADAPPATARPRGGAEADRGDTGTEKQARRPRFERVSPDGAPPRRGGVYREVPPEEALEDLIDRATVELSPEEEALLREAGEGGLAALIARTEHDALEASDADRPEKQRRYTMALNLLPKLEAEPEPEPAPELRALQQRYLRALAREQPRWAQLGPDERAARQDDLKQQFFSQYK